MRGEGHQSFRQILAGSYPRIRHQAGIEGFPRVGWQLVELFGPETDTENEILDMGLHAAIRAGLNAKLVDRTCRPLRSSRCTKPGRVSVQQGQLLCQPLSEQLGKVLKFLLP